MNPLKMFDAQSSFSLTPGFSRVETRRTWASRFNGLSATTKPLKRFCALRASNTGLKSGANEKIGNHF
jgi:hypothetical protein